MFEYPQRYPRYYITAYGIAVKHGFEGTEEEWLESLRGPKGDPVLWLGQYDSLEILKEKHPTGGTRKHPSGKTPGAGRGPREKKANRAIQAPREKQARKGRRENQAPPAPKARKDPAGKRGREGSKG